MLEYTPEMQHVVDRLKARCKCQGATCRVAADDVRALLESNARLAEFVAANFPRRENVLDLICAAADLCRKLRKGPEDGRRADAQAACERAIEKLGQEILLMPFFTEPNEEEEE